MSASDQLIDQYRIEKQLDDSTFISRFLAFDVDENRRVVVEILRSEYAADTRFASDFVHRAQALAQLRHPKIRATLQVGTTPDERPYTATEYVEAYTLAERLDQLERQQSPAHSLYALRLVRQIAEALVLVERLDIHHYALTPEHVLLKKVTLKGDDSVLLTDMAIPPEADTPPPPDPYLAPEQFAGKLPDGRAHVYSLGAMLFELLTGQPPPGPVAAWRPAVRRLTATRSPLEQARPELSPETIELVDRSLRRNPNGRYANLKEFLAALDAALAAEELRIHAGAAVEPAGSRRLPVWPVLLFAASVAIVLLLLGWLLPRNALFAGGVTPTNSAIVAAELTETAVATPTRAAATNTVAALQGGLPAETNSTTAAPTPLPSATQTPQATSTHTPTPTPTPTATPSPSPTPRPSLRVTFNSANVREGPGIVYPVVGYVYADDVLRIIGRSGGTEIWYNVILPDGTSGWVSAAVGEPSDTELETAVPIAATIPAPPPTSTPTSTPTNTPAPTPTPAPSGGGGNGGGGGGGENPRPTPTPPL